MRVIHFAFLTGLVGVLTVAAADDTTGRLERSVAVLNSINGGNNGHWAEQIAGAACVAVIPGFKKGAAVFASRGSTESTARACSAYS